MTNIYRLEFLRTTVTMQPAFSNYTLQILYVGDVVDGRHAPILTYLSLPSERAGTQPFASFARPGQVSRHSDRNPQPPLSKNRRDKGRAPSGVKSERKAGPAPPP